VVQRLANKQTHANPFQRHLPVGWEIGLPFPAYPIEVVGGWNESIKINGLARTGEIFNFENDIVLSWFPSFAFVYFHLRFGRDFFRRPTMCWNCNKAPENGFCPGCGWRMDNTPWGRYMGRSDLGMLEFASVQEHVDAGRKVTLLKRKSRPQVGTEVNQNALCGLYTTAR
jgi:hypothetical protein